MKKKSLLRRSLALLILAAIFLRELTLSSFAVAKMALARDPHLSPAIIAVPIKLRTDAGVATVANLVTLTPGTTSLHVSEDRSLLYVHCLDAPSAEAVVQSIKHDFERWVQEIEG